MDTHVWVRVVEGAPRRLGRLCIQMLERSRARGDLAVCAASIFEIAALYAAGRLDLFPSANGWVRESIEGSGLRVLEISVAVALDAGLIPATELPDPLDRLIVSTAAHAGIPLVTRDERILDYARDTGRVRVVDARR